MTCKTFHFVSPFVKTRHHGGSSAAGQTPVFTRHAGSLCYRGL